MTWQAELRAWMVASAAIFCLVTVGYRVLTLPKIPDLAGVVTQVNATVATANATLGEVNRPCRGSSCGTLANVEKLTTKLGDVAVDTQRQVQQTGVLINAASTSLTATSETVQAQLSHVGPLLDAGRAAAEAGTVAVAGLQVDAHGLLVNGSGAITDARSFINQPALGATITNVAAVTGSTAAITEDLRKVADKTTADYLRPVPWYLWPLKRSGEILDIGAAVARHTP